MTQTATKPLRWTVKKVGDDWLASCGQTGTFRIFDTLDGAFDFAHDTAKKEADRGD